MSWVAIDFETANRTRGSACALGVAIVEAGQVIDRASWLIRPPTLDFNPYNVMIHGITAADVASSPTFDLLWPTIETSLQGGRSLPTTPALISACFAIHSIPMDYLGLGWNTSAHECSPRRCGLISSATVCRW